MPATPLLILLLTMGIFFSCKRDGYISGTNAITETSSDSVYFDTLFTSTGSVTQTFKLYNRNNRKLRISEIELAGGQASQFRINADGFQGPVVRDLEMEANDSLYVFVTVTINPSSADLPFIVEDSINIRYNGSEKRVKLSAWGQNALFLHSVAIAGDMTWTNEKPIVILGGLLVGEQATLSIEKGTRIFLHADAPLFVDGTIHAEGEPYDSTRIVFTGDRLDPFYRDLPGSWPGIYFREPSRNNVLRNVTIRNAYQGIVVDKPPVNANPKLVLRECIVDNCYDAGIIGVETDIDAMNTLVSNCGKNLLLVKGGNHQFTHCTVASISNPYVPHEQPVLTITDFLKENETILTAPLKANFINCIFWGESGVVENEVSVLKEGNELFEVNFTHCLWKIGDEPAGVTTSNMLTNTEPLFRLVDTQRRIFDFRLAEGSPAINAGTDAGAIIDLGGNLRDPDNPDLGAWESPF